MNYILSIIKNKNSSCQRVSSHNFVLTENACIDNIMLYDFLTGTSDAIFPDNNKLLMV